MTPFLLLSVALCGESGYGYRPVELGTITVADARQLSGHLVSATFVVGCPPDTQDETTVIGCEAGGVERTAFVAKNWRLDAGDEVTVEGELRVIQHPPSIINGTKFPGFVEVRILDARLVKVKE